MKFHFIGTLITMDIFDLVDIQRVKHPNINKYSYVSKALKIRSRTDFFLVAKNSTKCVKKVDIQSSIAPDHKTVFISLHWPKVVPTGPGFWKFNNALLDGNNFVEQMRQRYFDFGMDFGKSINVFKIKECTGNCLRWKLGALLHISFAKGSRNNVFNLFNRHQRRKRSHGRRSNSSHNSEITLDQLRNLYSRRRSRSWWPTSSSNYPS